MPALFQPGNHLLGNLLCIRLIGILLKHTLQFIPGNAFQALRRADALLRIHAQIQRPFCFIRKTSVRIINLHGGNAQIRQYKIKFPRIPGHQIDICKVLQPDGKDILSITQLFQPFLCFCRLDRIHVQRVKMPLGLQAFQHLLCMASVAQRGIQPLLPRLDLQEIQNFLHTDRNMHSCGSASFFNYP